MPMRIIIASPLGRGFRHAMATIIAQDIGRQGISRATKANGMGGSGRKVLAVAGMGFSGRGGKRYNGANMAETN